MRKTSRAPTARKKAKTEALGPKAAAKPTKKRRATRAPRSKPKRAAASLLQVVEKALDELKASEVAVLDVRHLTTVTDEMVVASGRSDRHVRSIAHAVVEQCKAAGFRPLGVEGENAGEWVLVDMGDVVLHVMLPRVREFYNLEKLWSISASDETLGRGASS
jgi:ribosome-associated protein